MDRPTEYSREDLENLLKTPNRAIQLRAYEIVKDRKLPYKIVNDILYDVGESTDAWLSRFVTHNKQMNLVKEDIRKLAKIDDDNDQLFTVLICGETGTGKELLARALHGERVTDFLAINCAGLPENLIEAELFGHTEQAFTGATKTKDGLMKVAGTLFLDEIGELPLPAQAKLLRAIQSRTIRKVGSNKDEQIKCRIIAATHRDLRKMVDEQQFRLDLFARMSTFEIDTMPLRERPEDFVPIIQTLDGGPSFLQAVKDRKVDWNTDFNVRSLQQYVKRYKILGKLP